MKLLLPLLFLSTPLFAQFQPGNYSLVGQHEMAAGFSFKPDNTFEFFYIYGAVDRNATGTWLVKGDTLRLKSSKEAGKDFTVTRQTTEGKTCKIKITAPNPYLMKHVLCVVFVGEKQYTFESNEVGEIETGLKNCDKIYLQHSLFPDVLSPIKDEKNPNRSFEVSLNPSLQQVSFKGIDFTIDGTTLRCLPNYFLPMDNIRFEKE